MNKILKKYWKNYKSMKYLLLFSCNNFLVIMMVSLFGANELLCSRSHRHGCKLEMQNLKRDKGLDLDQSKFMGGKKQTN